MSFAFLIAESFAFCLSFGRTLLPGYATALQTVVSLILLTRLTFPLRIYVVEFYCLPIKICASSVPWDNIFSLSLQSTLKSI